MYEPSSIFAVLTVGLGTIAWFMIRIWIKKAEKRFLIHERRHNKSDERHNEHDVKHAILKTQLGAIQKTVSETSNDVKLLLKNGRRASG